MLVANVAWAVSLKQRSGNLTSPQISFSNLYWTLSFSNCYFLSAVCIKTHISVFIKLHPWLLLIILRYLACNYFLKMCILCRFKNIPLCSKPLYIILLSSYPRKSEIEVLQICGASAVQCLYNPHFNPAQNMPIWCRAVLLKSSPRGPEQCWFSISPGG